MWMNWVQLLHLSVCKLCLEVRHKSDWDDGSKRKDWCRTRFYFVCIFTEYLFPFVSLPLSASLSLSRSLQTPGPGLKLWDVVFKGEDSEVSGGAGETRGAPPACTHNPTNGYVHSLSLSCLSPLSHISLSLKLVCTHSEIVPLKNEMVHLKEFYPEIETFNNKHNINTSIDKL